MARVAGKVAFITGAGIGQGRSHAVRLAEEGADIIITDACAPISPAVDYKAATEEDLETTKKLVEKTGQRCVSAIADVRDRSAIESALDAGIAEFGHLDIVCANAGIMTVLEHSWDATVEEVDAVIDTNLKGAWNTAVCSAKRMAEGRRGGSIILISSTAGLRGQSPYASYTGSKHGVVGLMKAFANEFAPYRIRVNTVHPTGVLTEGLGTFSERTIGVITATAAGISGGTNVLPDLDADPDADYAPVPMLMPAEISNAVLWLASEEARYVTGVSLAVDAGNTVKP
ncbi:mycofactocin-coupled SDR family oxidoreductase [Gordonia sp. KTR9]|uniref:mycofactocin-coupled SDR family oxidoreductase n=1 Tax=Gordonia sp. KTR9 TaxID=337191 RepID=UPI00027DDBB7|nr:mycofactocin-coupled SDR family oxidoreductase [Gordonia sp. KTR9]AFR48170.1 short-chain dehydorgenase/reductase [Gordonia sp. KTR9]